MSLPAAALRRPVSTIAATLAVLLLGIVSLGRLPVSLLPDVALPVLTIRTSWPGAAAPEVSRFVAEPVEEAVAATPGLVELRSVSRNGQATTVMRFAWGTDMRATVLDVRERLDNSRGRLPSRAERPTLLSSDPGERPIAILAMSGPRDLRAIAQAARDVHARRLEQLAGVASVAVVGAPEDEIRIEVDPERLRTLGLTAGDVATAVRRANALARGGTVRRGQFRFSVRALTEFEAVEEIARTPVGQRGSVRLSDVATVRRTTADPRTLVRLSGEPAIGLVVYKDAGANTVAVTGEVERTLAELRREYPDFRITMVAAQAGFVTAALSNLGQEIVVGGLLSLVVILLMMGDRRGSFAVALIVPVSVLVSLTALQGLDVTINVLSLGGLALGVGLLVDNAIVVAEATGRKREQGVPALAAAREAAEELSGPLLAGTLTTLLVFGPIVFVRGLAAALFRDLSLSVVATLTASLILALTLLPVLLVGRSGYRGKSPTASRPDGALHRLGIRLAERYEHAMAWCLDRPSAVFAIAVATVGVAVAIGLSLPREILPRVDEGVVVADLRLAEGTSLEETARQVARIEAAAASLGGERIYSRVGQATDEEVLAGSDPGTAGSARMLLPVPGSTSAEAFVAGLRAALPDLAAGPLALDVAGQTEFGALIGREGRAVRVEITSSSPRDAEAFAELVRTTLRALPSLADVRDAHAGRQPVVELSLIRERLVERGLSPDAVADAIAGGLGGVAASELRETDRRTPIVVRFAGAADEDLNAALATLVGGVPARQLVEVREASAPTEVVRYDQRPVLVVEGVVEEGGTARASRDVARAVGALSRPEGVSVRVGGADAERRRTARELQLVVVLAVALVYLVLAGEFASFTTPLLVMLTVPLAGVGSLAALWITGQSLNTVALIGIVVMIGLADNEAVVKLAAIRRFREAGHAPREAAILGGRQRLRAITMTSLTTITGVLPLVFGWGSGGALYQPLAAAVIGGSITVLLVTFFLLPAAYVVVEERVSRGGARS
ncbi:MAG TPA: efflux RND transporter permease subunit [Gemmatimonadales bacterium]|nr:efflux RND transporter permease subunit [Gemmatimonadales bacterium]